MQVDYHQSSNIHHQYVSLLSIIHPSTIAKYLGIHIKLTKIYYKLTLINTYQPKSSTFHHIFDIYKIHLYITSFTALTITQHLICINYTTTYLCYDRLTTRSLRLFYDYKN